MTIPSGSESEITFISGVDSSFQVASKAYWGWNFDAPATYNGTQTRASKWGSTTLQASGTPANITYFFDTQSGSNWTQAEQNALLSGLHLWAAEANITFTLASSQQNANIVFVRGPNNGAANTSPQSLGATVGSNTTGAATQKIITIDTTPINTPAPGTAGFGPIGDPSQAISFAYGGGKTYNTILHEEGHALGLGHGGPYNQGDGKGPVQARQFTIYDSLQYSLMSYINPMDPAAKYFGNPNYPAAGTKWGTASSTGIGGVGLPDPSNVNPDPTNSNRFYPGNPTTPMMLDILAIQRIYGMPISGPLYSGGQIFGFNTNIAGDVGDYFNFAINQNPILTIWDAGFGNTLDLSGFTTSSTIRLTPGSFTNADGMTNNIAIAEDTWIDTAIGSQGINTIIGNDHSNTLTGGPLGDTLSGGGGDDTLRGGGGGDKLNGGAGINNTATYDNAPSGVVANLAHPNLNTGDAAGDTYTLIQHLTGSPFADVLTGDGGNNVIHGGAGNDVIHGGAGSNTLEGDADNDTLFAEGLAEGFFGGTGNDTVDYSLAVPALAKTGITADLKFSGNNTGAAANDLYDSIENLTGSSKGDELRGDDSANTIKGLGGNDILQGRGGLDTLTGGTGDDTYHLDDVTGSMFMLIPAFDSVVENPNEGTDTVLVSPLGRFSQTLGQTFYSYTLPANVEIGTIVDISSNHNFDLTGNELANTLNGNSLANTLAGLANNDTLNGGAGHDVLQGGTGDDTYVLDDVAGGPNILGFQFDTVEEDADEGFDTVEVSPLGAGLTGNNFIYALTDNVEKGIITGSGDFELDGNGEDNTLVGNVGSNTLKGMGGNDVLRGADGIPLGHDTLDGGLGSDTADLSNFTISPFFHVLQLDGDNPVNVPGAFIGAGITEGTQTLISIENLWGSIRAENFVGDDRDNTFRGGGGADTLDGGGGVNTADYSDKTVPVSVTLNGSTVITVLVNGAAEDKIKNFQNVIGGSNSDHLTGDGNDNTLIGNGGADTLKGGAGLDTLNGGEGNDVLMGGADDDALDGGDGADTADYSDKTLAVMVTLQTVQQRADGTPVDVFVGGIAEDTLINIENVYGGSNNDVLTGNDLANLLRGNAGDDTLRGGGGVDTLVGGIGSDTADYSDQSGSVVVKLAADLVSQRTDHAGLATIVHINGVADDRLYTIENITGGSGADHLVGNNLANTLLGNGNNDIIQGGGGSDSLDGGDGADTVDYSEKTASVHVTLDGATPTTVTVGGHDEDQISNFENIIGGSAGDVLTGDGGANTIDGRSGADTMVGLGGNDTYLVDNAKDVVTEAVGGGSDTVFTSVSYTLGAGQEIEFLTSSLHLGPTLAGPRLTGNEFAQTITGDGGADIIDGKGGADTMIGLGGNDTYYVDDPNDVVEEAIGGGALDRVFTSFSYTLGNGQEIETLSTVDHAATTSIDLNGNSFVNTIQGNAGDNVIDGRGGNDTLTGFGGLDSFDFTTALDPVNNVPTVTDFTVGNDKIGLSHVVFATLSGQLQAAQFSTGAEANGPDDRIIYNPDTGALVYDSNGNAEGSATQFAKLSPHLALSNTDFFIV